MGRKAVSIDIKKQIIVLRDMGISQHGISRQLKISRRCIRQTIRKYDKFHVVNTKPGGGRPRKLTDRDKRLIKLQQLRDESLSLRDLVQYTNTELNLSISISTISRILREYSLFSFIAPKKPRITARQRRDRIQWCHAHLNWSVEDWCRIIFSDESNFEVFNRKNRMYIRRFRNDRTRLERSQQRVHRGGGIGVWSYITCHGLGPLHIFDERMNSLKYIDILETHLPTALQKFSRDELRHVLYQQDNAGPHKSAMTLEYFEKKRIKRIDWPSNSPDLNLIENLWSIVDNKLLKLPITNVDDLKNALPIVWADISQDTVQKLFESMPRRLREVIKRKGFACSS